MIVKLNKTELFWSLINPVDVEDILIVLNESNSEVEVNFEKFPKWAQVQLESSVKLKRITTEPEIKDILATKAPEAKVVQVAAEPKGRKKVTKKATVVAKAIE